MAGSTNANKTSKSTHTNRTPLVSRDQCEPLRMPSPVRVLARPSNQREIMPEHPRPGNRVASRATPAEIPPFVRAMSSMLYLNLIQDVTTEETLRYPVCLRIVGANDAVALTSCGHKFCRTCFRHYLELKIKEGNVCPVCFHPLGSGENPSVTSTSTIFACGAAISPEQIKQLVDPEVYTKYEYFRFNKEHQHTRECPYCAHSQDCAGPENPVCVCAQCGKSFCFFHGNAHEDGSCADYELKHAKEEVLNRAKIDEISKPCPGCHRDVEKNGGCNHMKCIGCNTSFCWLCGEIIEDTPTPSHYATGSGSGCAGRQRQFDDVAERPHLTIWLYLLLFILTVVTVPVAGVLSALSAPFGWCCNRSKSLSEIYGAINETITVALVRILMFVLTPVGWVVTFCVDLVVVIGMIIYDISGACCPCCRSQRLSSDSFDYEDPFADDLETGLESKSGVKAKRLDGED